MSREKLASLLADVHFTETEQKIMYVLADGERHLIKDMIPVVDPEGTSYNVSCHVHNIKKKLQRFNHMILCEYAGRQTYYRYVILLAAL